MVQQAESKIKELIETDALMMDLEEFQTGTTKVEDRDSSHHISAMHALL
jgi:hypothetical protein